MARFTNPFQQQFSPEGVTCRQANIDGLAILAGALVLMAAGLGYRTLVRHLDRAPARLPFETGTLLRLPLEIADWIGKDVPLDEAVVRAADVDDYVNRAYVRRGDHQSVGLWIALGVRARDLMPHRPEVCYPAAGWTLRDRETVTLQMEGGVTLRARLLTFAPGGLDPRPLTVLNYYIVDDQTCEDVSLLRSKAWRGQASIRYMAQIQITCRMNPARPNARPADVVRDFAEDVFLPLRNLLDEAIVAAAAAEEA